MPMFKLFFILVLFSSCHVFLEEKLPYRSINFHEQLFRDALGYLKELENIARTESTLLTSAPPAAFFKKGDFIEYKKNENFLFDLKK